jgi:hypothetical protein
VTARRLLLAATAAVLAAVAALFGGVFGGSTPSAAS